MVRTVCAALMSLSLLGCNGQDPALTGAAAGGAAGALLGAAISDNDTKGAIIGGTLGAVAGATIANQQQRKSTPGARKCRYRDSLGREFIADCP